MLSKDGDMVWLYNPQRKKDQSRKLQSPREGSYTVGRKAQPKVVHINRLWQYHGLGQYTWKDSEELSPTTDEDKTRDPGRTQNRTDPGNPTMDHEEKHCSLLAELDVTGEGGPI
ncbi:hypothetical protein Hamer_G016393 [Homarus americanus]|uniref:Uncharacterized protein n=1 Tax=Homarus americanus TaxID=6706 RepID=A0A8J5TGS6_HOMAM|nr:hypothetical protein Hamer_G016393 [Homarus americanus]